jgi:hypothetical protein
MEGEIKLPLIVSPNWFGRNDFPPHRARERVYEGLAGVTPVENRPNVTAGVGPNEGERKRVGIRQPFLLCEGR